MVGAVVDPGVEEVEEDSAAGGAVVDVVESAVAVDSAEVSVQADTTRSSATSSQSGVMRPIIGR
jgi:hypothetical protein